MATGNLKIAGIRLVVEGASEFQKEVDRTEQALKENRAQLQMLDAQYGKHDDSLEKATAQEKLYAQQLELQQKRLQQLKEAQARHAATGKASQKDMDKASLAVMKQEARVLGLTREMNENRAAITQRQAALAQAAQQEAQAAQEAEEAAKAQEKLTQEMEAAAKAQEAYASSMAGVEGKLEASNAVLSRAGVEMQKLNAYYGAGSKNPEKLAKSQELLTQSLEAQKAKTEALRQAWDDYSRKEGASTEKIREMTAAVDQAEIQQAGLERQLRETNEEIQRQAQVAKQAGKDLDAWAKKRIEKGQKNIQRGAKLTRNTLMTVGAGFTYSAKEAVEFEDAFAQVLKTVDGAEGQLDQLREGAMALSASGAITQSKEEVADIMGVAGQLGISTDHIMGFSKAMLQMGDATNLGAEDAASQLAQFANITQMSQNKFENLGSAIVALGNKTATQEDAIVALGMRIAAAGSQADMSVASIMGISAALSSVGVEAEAGGTAISKVLINMDTAAAKGEKALKGYSQVAGMSAKEFKRLWDRDSAQALAAFVQGLGRIDQEGGNLAATLEKLGYKETRTRDALMRAAMAGDLLGDSISLANRAYIENTALADESAKKNETFAARLKILQNRADNAAMGLGEALMPALESGMNFVSGLVEQFGALDKSQRQNIVTMGGIALAAGPVTAGFGMLETGIGKAVQGFKAFKGLMAGSGWAGWAILGLTGICAALAAVQTPLEQVQRRLENVEFTVDEDLAAKINAGIQAGIDGAQRAWTATVTVNTEMDTLGGSLDGALADGKLSKKETKSLKKQLDDLIKADIDEAQKELQASVDAYVGTLAGLKTATGEDLFSAEEKAKIISDIEGKTSSLITELETYQQEYNTLLTTIYKQNEPVTAQQMAELDALMDKIRATRAEIALATDEAVQAARAQYDMTVGGRGNEKTSGAAIGYVQGTYSQAVQEAEKAYNAALAATTAMTDADAQMAKREEALATYNKALDDAADKANEGYAAILGGEAKRLGVDDELERLNELGKGMDVVSTSMAAMAEMPVDQVQRHLQYLFGEGGALAGYKDMMNEWDRSFLNTILMAGDETLGPDLIKSVRDAMPDLITGMKEEAANIAEMSEMDPLTTLFQSMFNAGAFDPSTLDLTMADGALGGVLNLLDFTGKGEQFGYDFSVGVGSGIADNATEVQTGAEKLVDAAGGGLGGMIAVGVTAANNIINGLIDTLNARKSEVFAATAAVGALAAAGVNSKEGIDAGSPSKKARQSARWVVEGLTDEMAGMGRIVERAGARLGERSLEGLNDRIDQLTAGTYRPEVSFQTPIAGSLAAMEHYAMHGGSNVQETVQNDYSSFSFNVGQLVVREEADARAVALEASNILRRKNAGYGTG